MYNPQQIEEQINEYVRIKSLKLVREIFHKMKKEQSTSIRFPYDQNKVSENILLDAIDKMENYGWQIKISLIENLSELIIKPGK